MRRQFIRYLKYRVLITGFLFTAISLTPVNAQKSPDGENETGPLFYPSAPDPPRVQFLTSFSNARDVKEKKEKSGWLSDFVLGEESPDDFEGPNKPYGVDLNNGQIHVVDTRGAGYAIFDVAAKDYRFREGAGGAFMPKPVNIEVDADGRKYVTDTQRNQILVFDSDDEYLTAFGDEDQFRPTDVLVDDQELYVVDILKHRVVVLDKSTGAELRTFASTDAGDEKLFQPTNIAMGPNKHLFISDTGNFRVQEFTQDGRFVRTYGTAVGTAPGNFARPKGVAVDRMGRVYVVDAAFERVQVFDDQGNLLMFFGEPAARHRNGLDLPTSIDIDYDSVPYFQKYADPEFELEFIIVVANQFGYSKVSVFGFGRHKSMSYDEE